MSKYEVTDEQNGKPRLFLKEVECIITTTTTTTFLTLQQFNFSHNSTGLTEQALHINCSATDFPHMWHVLSITAVCNRIYIPGRRSSSFKHPCNLYPTIPALDRTGGIIRTVCSCYILIRYSFKSVYLWSFSVMVL